MKTVVASYMVWMREIAAAGPPYPPFNLLLVGNEENGEGDPFGTPHVLKTLEKESGELLLTWIAPSSPIPGVKITVSLLVPTASLTVR